jgi:hypothetical protein
MIKLIYTDEATQPALLAYQHITHHPNGLPQMVTVVHLSLPTEGKPVCAQPSYYRQVYVRH